MPVSPSVGDGRPTRRGLLAGGAALTTGLASGCLQRVQGLMQPSPAEQVSVSIKTTPADDDEPATLIARHLAGNLAAAGIEANVTLKESTELRRDVLLLGDFEIYVDRLPLHPDPDVLRPLLHSVFSGAIGWQNPYGFTSLAVDDLLDEQRRAKVADRYDAAAELLQAVAREQPFVPVAIPSDISAVRSDQFTGWMTASLASPLRYLGVSTTGDGLADQLRVVTTDERLTVNLNPLSARFRDRGTVTGLLYDALGRRIDGQVRPWLAQTWRWLEEGPGTRVEVTVRPDQEWHDGTALTAGDVAFTYRFLQDTRLGETDAAVPAPRLHGRAALVDGVERIDRRTVRLAFGETAPPAALRALTVPVLPQHVWRSKAADASLGGVNVSERLTEAIVWPNEEPVGSGPLAFKRRIADEGLILERFDPHFLNRDRDEPVHPNLAGGVDYGELSFRVAPTADAAVQLVAANEADATMAITDPSIVPRIGRSSALSLLVDRADVLYHVGFNTRQEPFSNPHFRRAVARLVDKGNVASDVFGGYAMAVGTPLDGSEWTPSTLEWTGRDPEVPFLGSEGEVHVGRAREHFRDIGYQYNDGDLLVQ